MKELILFLKRFRIFLLNDKQWNIKNKKFICQLEEFKKTLPMGVLVTRYPCLEDATKLTPFEPHYNYHPAWAARVLAKIQPKKHIDISSVTHFSNIVSAFIPVEFYDYRPAKIILSNYLSGEADLTKLHFATNSINSLSCMHTLEHIGLGRYGDPIDMDGDIKAFKELQRVLAVSGNLLVVVPVGKSRVEFNAHRIYSYNYIIEQFSQLVLQEFALVPDAYEEVGYLINPPVELIDSQNWGCGCFWFTKK